jgi:hypothetical protein
MIEKDYYRRIKTALLYSKEYCNLMGKSEIGEDFSQYATVDLASTLSEYMAEELGFDQQKSSVLAMCKGIVFPPYGKAGMKYIKQLANSENINIDEAQICKNIIDKILKENKFEMTVDFENSIQDLFSSTTQNNESVIVNNVYSMLNDIFILRENSLSMQTKLNNKTFDIIEDAISESKNNGQISYSPKLQQLKQTEAFKLNEEEISDEQEAVLKHLWQHYKEKGLNLQEIVSSIITEQER